MWVDAIKVRINGVPNVTALKCEGRKMGDSMKIQAKPRNEFKRKHAVYHVFICYLINAHIYIAMDKREKNEKAFYGSWKDKEW